MTQTVAPSVSGHAPALKFVGSDRFIRELRKRVDAYFEQTGRNKRDVPAMYFKTITIMLWFFGAYFLLLFAVHSLWLIIPLAVVLGLALAAIGFNIQHDGGHKAYSNHQWINRVMASTLDLMGGSSYMWNWKHNTIHHTYTNLAGHDDDINLGMLGRLAPGQKHLFFHRFQGIYLWLLYGFLAIKWHLFDDFHQLVKGQIAEHKIPRPKGKDLAIFISGKVFFFSMAFGVPMLLHPWWAVLSVYALAAFVSGVVLSVVFQLAHCVTEADFPTPTTLENGSQRVENEWAIHQVETTVDFCRGNPFMCWFLGGLNFQVEHHLFHKISHIHYPALSKIVEQTCAEFGVKYAAHKSFVSAVASHFRWLVQMGRPNPTVCDMSPYASERNALGDEIEARWPAPLRDALHRGEGNYRIYSAWRGCVKRGEFDHLRPFVNPDRASIDVGANMGQYSLTLAAMSTRCLSIEPLEVYRFLAEVLPGNCVFRSVAAGDRTETATLRIPVLPNGNVQFGLATIAPDNELPGYPLRRQETSVALLDEIVDEAMPGESIGFIKIDVEGHELAVLAGARRTIQKHRPVIQVEILPQHLADARRLLAELNYGGEFFFGRQQFPIDAFREPIHCALENAWFPERHEAFDAEFYVSNFFFLPV